MHQLPSLDEFRRLHKISEETWTAANIAWSDLAGIFSDYCDRYEELTETAALHARMLQRCKAVHSVRWRVKDPEHVVEKIIRKRAAGSACGHFTFSSLIGVRFTRSFQSAGFHVTRRSRMSETGIRS